MTTPASDNGSPATPEPTSFDDANLVWADDGGNEAGTAPEADSQSAASPESAPADASSLEAAKELPPAANTDGAQGQAAQGPIPFERHQAILKKERDRADRVAWAQDLADAGITDAKKIHDAIRLYDGVDGDPLGFIERYIEVLKANPDLAQAAEAMLGRVAGGHGAARGKAAGDEAEPQPDLENRETGELAYSPGQMRKWQAWSQRQAAQDFEARLDQRLAERLKPVEQDLRARQQEMQAQQIVQDEATNVQREFNDVKDLPFFSEHKAAIKAVCAQHDYRISLKDAYLIVLKSTIAPSLTQRGAESYAARLKQQHAASSASPSAASTAPTPKAPKSFSDKTLVWD